MLIALLVVVGLSLLILGHEAGHFFAAKMFGLKIDEFGFGFPPRIAAWRRGETEYSLNWLPFGGFVRIAGERGEFEMVNPDSADGGGAGREAAGAAGSRLLSAQPAWKKSAIMLAGVFMNFLLGWLLLSLTLMSGAPRALVIASVAPHSPAAAAGLVPGDVIRGYAAPQDFISYVDAHRGTQISITIDRGGKTAETAVVPRVHPPAGQGAIGIGLAEAGTAREGFFAALRGGFIDACAISWITIIAFGHLIAQLFSRGTLPAGVVGPVGIFGVAEETGRIGLVYLLQLIGVISLNLMVVNLIPFPALDGGRFVMAIIEKIKGSAIPYKVEAWINGAGFALLLALMALLTIRDVRGLL